MLFSYNYKMNKIRKNRIKELRQLKGLSQGRLGEKVGLSHVQIGRIENGTSDINTTMLVKLADALSVQPEDIMGMTSSIQRVIENVNQEHADMQRIPVYGVAAAGDGDKTVLINDGSITTYIEPSPDMKNIKDAFAVEVLGESMDPLLRPGHRAIINPNQLPRKGEECLVEMNDGTAIFKMYVRRDADQYIFENYNKSVPPLKEFGIHISKIKRICAVAWVERRR